MHELAYLSMGGLRTKPGSTPSAAGQYSLRDLHVNIMLNPLSGAHLARAGLATENPEFTWGDSPDLNISAGSKACGLEWL
jgi:hypothetical protein